MSIIEDKIKRLPNDAGVYMMKDADLNVIYVGKAKNLKKRVSQYFLRHQEHVKVQNMVKNVVDFDFFVVSDEIEALALENNLIKKYKPFYNILLKDSKTYAYIKINMKDEYPHFEISRRLNKTDKYFGPYMAGVTARDVIKILDYAFPLKKCKLKLNDSKKETRPCIFYDMKMCLAPCAKKTNKDEYMVQINDAVKFLKGDTKQVEKILQEKMVAASEMENFETALEIRDRLKMLDKMKSSVITSLGSLVDYDVFNLVTNGEYSAMCVLIVRGGKLQGVSTYDILNYLDIDEAYTQFVMQYYSTYPIIAEEIILPNINTEEIELFINNHSKKKVVITKPIINSKKFKLLDMARKNAQLHIEKNLETVLYIDNSFSMQSQNE